MGASHAGTVLMDGPAFPPMDFKLNPNVSAVCPASDTLAGDRAPCHFTPRFELARRVVPGRFAQQSSVRASPAGFGSLFDSY